MANDRRRAVARAKHKLEVSFKRKQFEEMLKEESYILSLPIGEQIKYRLNKALWIFKKSVEDAMSLLDQHNLIIHKDRLRKIFGGEE